MVSLNRRTIKNTKETLQRYSIGHFGNVDSWFIVTTMIKIIEWGSETIIIPYISPVDKRPHKYFPDFFIKYVNSKGQVIREVIEVKPKRQLNPPKEPKRRTKSWLNEVRTYMVNQAKFKAADEYCKDRKYSFRILTEDHLT